MLVGLDLSQSSAMFWRIFTFAPLISIKAVHRLGR
jgi:hypothetical protein